MSSKVDLSLILPVLNEADFIESVTLDVKNTLDSAGFSYELLMVENGSTDGSLQVLERMAAQHPTIKVLVAPHKGWGLAILTGQRAARGEYVGHMPSDGQVAASTVPEVFAHRGPRTVAKIKRVTRENATRIVNTKVYNTLANNMFGLGVDDINGCPKIYPRAILPALELTSLDSFIDLEMLIKVRHLGFAIDEVPTQGLDRVGGKSNTNWRTVAEFLRNMAAFKVSPVFEKWKKDAPTMLAKLDEGAR